MLNTKQLSVMSYANLFTMWYYKTKTGEKIGEDYFNDCFNIFNDGDIIRVNFYDDVINSKSLTEVKKFIIKKIDFENKKVKIEEE